MKPNPAPPNQTTPTVEFEGERLQKLMARAGIASRRAAETLITQGRVTVNGHVITELGAKADPTNDRIVIDGKSLKLPTGPATVILLHKPKGVVTTKKDPEGRTTVLQYLPAKYHHLHPVGRLDFDTSGVLLLTDDGDLTQLLTHPSHGVEKVYWARVRGQMALETIKQLEAGIYLEDGKTAPCRVRVRAHTEQNSLVEITLREGRNRQVRRMLEAVGFAPRALRRVSFGGLKLEGMLTGAYRVLLPGEAHLLRKAAEKKKTTHKPAKPRKPTRTTPRADAKTPTGAARTKPTAAKMGAARTATPRAGTAQTAAARPVRGGQRKPSTHPAYSNAGQAPTRRAASNSATPRQSAVSRPPAARPPAARPPAPRAQSAAAQAGSKPRPPRPPQQAAARRETPPHPLARRIGRQWDKAEGT